MDTVFRPSVRVCCIDAGQRILLMCWRDPATGRLIWEPPGGGVEPGETPLATARRELGEETGLSGTAVSEHHVVVHRDLWWNGRHFVGPEPFFLARFDEHRPALSRDRLLPAEVRDLADARWLAWPDVLALAEHVEPPQLADTLGQLVPAGPWSVT